MVVDAYQQASSYRYTKSGERIDNITDWALNKFVAHYGAPRPLAGGVGGGQLAGVEGEGGGLGAKKKGPPLPPPASGRGTENAPPASGRGTEGVKVTKDAIFAYCYAVLHDPVYRETYALNLKREFPRIPFYPDFARWAAWGEALMALHIGYESVEPWPIERIETPPKRAAGTHPKPVLKSVLEQGADKGNVMVDADTQLTGIPAQAWDYRLGNRSAIDWVLDQHKEKTPRDPVIAAKFNTYRFADYKEPMIDLLARVVRVSVETVAITEAKLPTRSWSRMGGSR